MRGHSKLVRLLITALAIGGAAFAGVSLLASLRHMLGRPHSEQTDAPPAETENQRIARIFGPTSVVLPLKEWGVDPLPADVDLDAFAAANPRIDQAPSQIIIQMREEDRA